MLRHSLGGRQPGITVTQDPTESRHALQRPMLFRSDGELLWYDVWAEADVTGTADGNARRWVAARRPVGGGATAMAVSHDGKRLRWSNPDRALQDIRDTAAVWEWR